MSLNRKLDHNTEKTIFFTVFGIFLIGAFLLTYKKEKSLMKNSNTTLGKVIAFKNGVDGNNYIHYKYYVNGDLYEGSDPYSVGWPEHKRENKPILDKFYYVEYDSLNPEYAKIIIGKKAYFDYEIPEINGIEQKGRVEKISNISNNYVDLYINYRIYERNFSFRSRFHKDSLPCKDYENCLNSEVDLKVAEMYPELNSLYFQSYDRTAMRKSQLKSK